MKKYFVLFFIIMAATVHAQQNLSRKDISGNWHVIKFIWADKDDSEKESFPRFEKFFLGSKINFDSTGVFGFTTSYKDRELEQQFSELGIKKAYWYYDPSTKFINIYTSAKRSNETLALQIQTRVENSLTIFHIAETPLYFSMKKDTSAAIR